MSPLDPASLAPLCQAATLPGYAPVSHRLTFGQTKDGSFVCRVRKEYKRQPDAPMHSLGHEVARVKEPGKRIRVIFDNGVVADIYRDFRVVAYANPQSQEPMK